MFYWWSGVGVGANDLKWYDVYVSCILKKRTTDLLVVPKKKCNIKKRNPPNYTQSEKFDDTTNQ